MVSDTLISGATHLCKTHDEVSYPLFQRVLMIDADTAEEVFDELVRIGLVDIVRIEGEDDDNVVIGQVNKERIQQLDVH